MKICPVGAELFHADGQTHITTRMVALCKLVSATNNMIQKVVSSLITKYSA
jgi:hypothetical protein